MKIFYETEIIKDTLPPLYLGVTLTDRFGVGPTFFKEGKEHYFQAKVFYQIFKHATGELLFEFRTVRDFLLNKSIDNDGFYELVNSFISTAIGEFNGKFKAHSSDMIIGKSYTPHPTFEQNKEAIRKAYMLAQFDSFPGIN